MILTARESCKDHGQDRDDHREIRWVVVVQERVTSIWIFLHVMGHTPPLNASSSLAAVPRSVLSLAP